MENEHMESVKVNINVKARIKLNVKGREILKSSKYIILAKEDGEGYIEMPLWELMHVFGPYLYMGPSSPIYDNEIEIWLEC